MSIMPKKDNSYNDADDLVASSQISFDDDDDDDSVHISDDEESARDDYLNRLGRLFEQVQDELEAEAESSDAIFVDPEKVTEAIQTLTELLQVRSDQLAEKDLPTHVDEKVEEYR